MADKSKIEWTEATWNPIRAETVGADGTERKGWHCEHVSEGCRNCYAETFNKRLGTGFDYKPGHLRPSTTFRTNGYAEVYLDEKMLTQVLRWKKPRQIFVCSMTDLFADFVSDEMLDRIFAVMALCPQHTFQLLTKRSARMREYLARQDFKGWCYQNIIETALGDSYNSFSDAATDALSSNFKPYHDNGGPVRNVWLGVSVENQAAADERIPDLLATPAAVRWLSCEPLLGPVNLRSIPAPNQIGGETFTEGWHFDSLETGDYYTQHCEIGTEGGDGPDREHRIDWVVAGGESGTNARPMHPNWARSLRDQCAAADVPFFFKQWGNWAIPERASHAISASHDHAWPDGSIGGGNADKNGGLGTPLYRTTKTRGGRLLDGKTHDAMPVLSAVEGPVTPR